MPYNSPIWNVQFNFLAHSQICTIINTFRTFLDEVHDAVVRICLPMMPFKSLSHCSSSFSPLPSHEVHVSFLDGHEKAGSSTQLEKLGSHSYALTFGRRNHIKKSHLWHWAVPPQGRHDAEKTTSLKLKERQTPSMRDMDVEQLAWERSPCKQTMFQVKP